MAVITRNNSATWKSSQVNMQSTNGKVHLLSVNSHSSLFHTVPVSNLLMMKSNPKPLEEAQCNVAMENSKRLSQTDMVKMQCT